MDVMITSQTKTADGHIFEMTCGKQSAHIWVSAHHVMVCNLNASHRAWGGLGKRFNDLEAALNGYKSAAMRAMIQTASAAI
jgi:hypothetical protein